MPDSVPFRGQILFMFRDEAIRIAFGALGTLDAFEAVPVNPACPDGMTALVFTSAQAHARVCSLMYHSDADLITLAWRALTEMDYDRAFALTNVWARRVRLGAYADAESLRVASKIAAFFYSAWT